MTRATALSYLKKFYSTTSENSVSVEDIFKIYHRNLADVKPNKTWLGNKLTYMKRLDFVKPVYGSNGVSKILLALELGESGKIALGRISEANNHQESLPYKTKNGHVSTQTVTNGKSKVTLLEIIDGISKLKREYPEFEITFDMKLKNII